MFIAVEQHTCYALLSCTLKSYILSRYKRKVLIVKSFIVCFLSFSFFTPKQFKLSQGVIQNCHHFDGRTQCMLGRRGSRVAVHFF